MVPFCDAFRFELVLILGLVTLNTTLSGALLHHGIQGRSFPKLFAGVHLFAA